jgi:hypothetical protein
VGSRVAHRQRFEGPKQRLVHRRACVLSIWVKAPELLPGTAHSSPRHRAQGPFNSRSWRLDWHIGKGSVHSESNVAEGESNKLLTGQRLLGGEVFPKRALKSNISIDETTNGGARLHRHADKTTCLCRNLGG